MLEKGAAPEYKVRPLSDSQLSTTHFDAALEVFAAALGFRRQHPRVDGQEYQRLSFSFTVSARDQWWAHRRAMRLAEACCVTIGLGVRKVPEPMWETLAPHDNRGRYRTPR